jgi:hypothetical protein
MLVIPLSQNNRHPHKLLYTLESPPLAPTNATPSRDAQFKNVGETSAWHVGQKYLPRKSRKNMEAEGLEVHLSILFSSECSARH